tara:strand:+ start:3078 stop:9158 length:6081 start_codon:yes stop_codon:yes gene_type:complete
MSRYIKGLIRDTSPSDQPEGSWRYARNAVVNRVDGTVGNEEGNKAGPPVGRTGRDRSFYKGYKVIGTIEVTDDRIIVFSVASNPSEKEKAEYGRSEIGILYPSGEENQDLTYKTLLNFPTGTVEGANCTLIDTSLKFLPRHPISGTYKIDAKENLIVYWTDDFNPARSLNVTRQERAVAEYLASNTVGEPYEQLYGRLPENSINKNFIDRLNMFPHAGPVPSVDLHKVISGGGLVSASYALALAYVDKDLVVTNYVVVDNPVSIVDDIESVLPIERYDGAPPGTQTGKSIVWNISDYNTDYDYIRPAIIQHLDGNRFAFQLHDIEILADGPDFELTFSGTEGYTSSSVDDIVIDTIAYDTVKTLTQLDNVLYLGNLKRNLDVGYQKNAGDIQLSPKVINVTNFDPFSLLTDNLEHGFIEMPPLVADKSKGYRNPYNSYKRRGYTRGEVYAFYIAFILNDGSMSYAYHIPGRGSISTEMNDLEDSSLYNASNLNALGEVKNYHFKSYSEEVDSRNMEYWENSHETYPNTLAFNSEVYKNEDGSAAQVRHHRFPKNDNAEYRVIAGSTTTPITTEVLQMPALEFTIDNVAVNNNQLEDLGITWVLEDGSLLGPDSGDFDNKHEAWHVTNAGGLVVGSTYVITWTSPLNSGSFLGECIAVDVTSGWALFDHSQSQAPGLWGAIGFGSSDTYGNFVTDGDYPNETNLWNEDKVVGTIYSSTTAGASQAITGGGTTSDDVRILGFTLDNIKIPAAIAKKVQGFRIYYADRQHEDKRILGQGVATPYEKIRGQLGGCILNSDGAEGIVQNFWMKTPLTYNDSYLKETAPNDAKEYQMLAFYNFELLRSQKSISPATHISPQWVTTYHTFKGPGAHHETSTSPCDVEIINSRFYVAESYSFTTRVAYRLLKERCKTYVNGDSILDASGHGFGYKLYNQGGETHIALGISGDANNNGFLPRINNGANNPVIPIVDNPSSYLGVQSSAYTINLEAFKTDVYNTVDSQNLIWTGFEIKGKNLENFIEDGDGDYSIGHLSGGKNPGIVEGADCDTPVDHGPPGEPTVILGGDTFICKYGVRQSVTPRISTYLPSDQVSVLYSIIESTDNINFRHEEDVSTTYFPGSPMQKTALVDRDGKSFDLLNLFDFTGEDKIKYNPDYSGVNNVRPAFVLPNLITAPSVFTTRIQRSTKASRTSLIDNFRIFLSQEFKDMPKNRGELWKLSTFNNLLYIHMEDSLLVTKGKQTMAMKDGTEAFIGSGDIFQQEPDELVQTEHGYGGTQSQYSTLVTKYGYFSVDERNKKVFMTTDKMTEISNLGLEKWFYNNLSNDKGSFNTTEYDYAQTLVGGDQYSTSWGFRYASFKDSPIIGKGLVSVWDEKYQRILLTKRALLLTERGKILQRMGGRSEPGGIVYNEKNDTYGLLFNPSVSLLYNGDFSYGNELVENTSFTHSDFNAAAHLPASFFWLESYGLVRSLTSNVFDISYDNTGYIYQYFSLEKGQEYTFETTWKGTNGINVDIIGVGAILTTNAKESTLTSASANFVVPTTRVYEIRIQGASRSASSLSLAGTSLKKVAHPVWSVDSSWDIRDSKITNDGTAGSFSQGTASTYGDRRLLTFTIQGMTTGIVSVYFGAANTALRSFSEDGTYTIDDTWKGSGPELSFSAQTGFDGSIADIILSTVPNKAFTVTDGNFYVDTNAIKGETDGIQAVEIPFTSSVTIATTSSSSSTDDVPQDFAEIGVIWQRVGWTISFYPELNAWGSLHDYLPHHYTYTSKTFYSFYNWKEFPSVFWTGVPWIGDDADESYTIWAHNSVEAPGSFYGSEAVNAKFTQPFELEVVENKERDASKIFSSFKYETEVFEAAVPTEYSLNQVRYKRLDKDGFTQFFVYNNTQHSGVIDIKYLKNIRKIGHMWNINKFRDMARLYSTTFDGYTADSTTTVTSGFPNHISSHLLATLENAVVDTNLDFVGNNDVHDMFEATWGLNGAYTIFTHPSYIDSTKSWTKQRKFTDTYLGIRLIYDNINKNFVNLYSTSVAMRKYNR